MKTLAIETSCDDTSVGIVSLKDGYFGVEELLSFSQVDIHQEYGGVVPELAYRSHADKIVRLLEELGGDSIGEMIDCISVTTHPGLPGSLQVGITTAYTLGAKRDKPIVEVNHIMGHVFSILLERTIQIERVPYICLTVSGGHNDIYLVDKKGSEHQSVEQGQAQAKRMHLEVGETIAVGPFVVTKIGQTIDDAAGEAFDKVARMLGGPYPGGPRIGQLAEQWQPDDRVSLSASFLKADEYLFSFSGLKSQVGQLIEQLTQQGVTIDEQLQANIARRFQEEATHVLAKKLSQAAEQYQAKAVGLVGGVSANVRLREYAQELIDKRQLDVGTVLYPEKFVYCTDNAAMIGAVGLLDFVYGQHDAQN